MTKKENAFSEIKKDFEKKEEVENKQEVVSDANTTDSQKKDIDKRIEKLFNIGDEKEKLLAQKRKIRKISLIAIICGFALIMFFIIFSVISGQNAKIDVSLLAADIDGKKITLQEVSEWTNFMQSQPHKGVIKEVDVLKQLIAYELLVNKANEDRIKVSPQDINDFYNKYNGMTYNSLERILAEQSISIPDFKIYLEHTLMIQKLFEKELMFINVTEKDISDFITNNKDFIEKQTMGKNLTQKEIDESVRLTLVDLRKEELKNVYINELMKTADIIYYNKFEILMNPVK
ncbi:MAG: SurA N-terminal domain-containing protein [Candidatus Woesearchaeota archaeon]|jgi:hypothetical protein